MDNKKIIEITSMPNKNSRKIARLECGHYYVWDEEVDNVLEYRPGVGGLVSCNQCPDDEEWISSWESLL